MNLKKYTLVALFLSLFFAGHAVDIKNVSKLVKEAKPGDVIVIDNGEYQDITLSVLGKGTKEKPIIVKAQTPGGVVLTGQSTLRLGGEYVEVQGLLFTDGYAPKGAVIEFRNGKEAANNCRITDCAIIDYTLPNRTHENIWVNMYGRNNRFDHNTLVGKSNLGCVLVVQLNEERHQQNQHRIDHNYFSRPLLGSNGGEVIRVGNSQYAMTSSQTLIEQNYFHQCNGEVEVVSIKACDNIVRNNTFFECEGVVALRHGDRNLVEGNAFIGNNKLFTGGVRIVNEGHIIRNNYFENLKGYRFFAALAVMNAVPNSLPNRYHQVKNVQIAGNVWNNCDNIEFGVGADNERTLAPDKILVENNVFYNPSKAEVYSTLCDMSGFTFRNNTVTTSTGKYKEQGFSEKKNAPKNIAVQAAKREDCGTSWSTDKIMIVSAEQIEIKTGQNTLLDAVESAEPGSTIILTEAGEYINNQTIAIDKALTIKAAEGLENKVVIRYNGTQKSPQITIMDGGDISLSGLWFKGTPFDGQTSPIASIAPNTVMKGSYAAEMYNCRFSNYQESSFSAFRAQKGTFATKLIFRNCFFHEISGDAIYLATEKDDKGTYNAEYTYVENCKFYNILGAAIDLYRGGSDESTSGPYLSFKGNILENVNNKERGSAVRVIGAQRCFIEDCNFINSGRSGSAIRFDEATFDIISVKNCNLYNSGRIFSFYDKVITGPITNNPPTTSLKDKL